MEKKKKKKKKKNANTKTRHGSKHLLNVVTYNNCKISYKKWQG